MKKFMNKLAASVAVSAMAMSSLVVSVAPAHADNHGVCSETVKILAQPRDGLTLLEDYQDEFKALSGANFQIDYLNENDRRAKSQADASTIGNYNVYYVDEANIALFTSSDWLVPLLDHYPAEYDYADFDPGRQAVATVDGTVWFAPIQGGGDLLVYRKDLLEKAGLEVPKTLDDFKAAVKAMHDPDNGIYGIGLRGQRGSGANVWRWMPYFRGFGGEWFTDGKSSVNSQAAIDATNTYLELFEFSAPGTRTGSWDESTTAFRSGQIAIIVESAPLGGIALDKTQSQVADKIGFARPPAPLTGGGYGHGFAIAKKGNPDKASRDCAGLWAAWATSKEQEQRRLAKGQAGELNRSSIFNSSEFAATFGDELPAALADTANVTRVNFWQDAQWPELGNQWGIILEELITGTRSDVPEALAELEAFANDLVK